MSGSGSPSHRSDNRRPPRRSARASPPAPARALTYGEARQANLEADTRAKHAQAQALEDEHALLVEEARGLRLDNERKEIANGLLLVGFAVALGIVVAEIALALVAPGAHRPGESVKGLLGLLLSKG